MIRAACRVLLLALFLTPGVASARTSEPGTFFLGPVVGPSFKLNSLLGGSPAFFVVGGQGEYVLDSQLSVVGDVDLSLASSFPIRVRGGVRYHLFEVGGALSPYVQAQLGLGELFNIIGANLFWLGGRVAVGTDYFFTSDLAAGAMLAGDLGTSTGVRPAFYGLMELLLYVSFRLA